MVVGNIEETPINGEPERNTENIKMIVEEDNSASPGKENVADGESGDTDDIDKQNDEDDQQPTKRVKTGKNTKKGTKSKSDLQNYEADDLCPICCQKLNDPDLQLYLGHPNNAVEEYNVLLDPKLGLFNGDELDISEGDMRAFNKVTSFSVYDKNGHLCSFDGGLIEKNVLLYFSGYVKAIYEEDPSIENGIPGKDLGPIAEWYVCGFDGSDKATICFSTELGEYVLMESSEEYAPFMVSVREKTFLSKIVIEFLLDTESPTYDDLLNKLSTVAMPVGLPKFTNDVLLHHAQFLCDQIQSFDDSALPEDELLITKPCIRTLISIGGISFSKGKIKKGKVKQSKKNYRRQEDEWRQTVMRKAQKDKQKPWTKATTTPLVKDLFENFFPDQLDKTTDGKALKRRRCGVCEPCQRPDCGQCTNCKNMIKFGGPGRSKQACVRRRCPNMEIQEANDDDLEDQEDVDPTYGVPSLFAHRKRMGDFKKKTENITWVGDPLAIEQKGTYYKTVMLDLEKIEINDYVIIESVNPSVPLQIVRVVFMWENKMGIKMFHANWLWRGSETVLGETSNSSELFLVDDCQDVPLSYVKSKTTVVRKEVPEDWAQSGNLSLNNSMDDSKEDVTSFFYQKRYDHYAARFEDPLPELEFQNVESQHRFCSVCIRGTKIQQKSMPQVHEKIEEKSSKEVIYGMVKFKDQEYRVGNAVFFNAKTFKYKFPIQSSTGKIDKKENYDEERYPEYYRKSQDKVKGSNFDTPEPFDIGYITCVFATSTSKLISSNEVFVKVKKLYRPENTNKSEALKERSDINLLYWSEEEVTVAFSEVVDKCYLTYGDNVDTSVEEWTSKGPNRFYFTQMYDSKSGEFDEPPAKACTIGKFVKKCDKIKSKSKKAQNQDAKLISKPPEYPMISKKLRTLDVFAGCGGLSEGLHQAGIAENGWAIEVDEAAANAYRINNPDAKVFTGDCNFILKQVMEGNYLLNGQTLPKKGEVDLLCGGPPCQGFSGMNRFNSRAYSLFKNSLVVSYLSYCEYYRPKFFIMENVRNFVSFKKSLVLKLTLRCLIKMGYQCTFGILQAGNYGVPQTRRRMFLIAAGPGEILPVFPNPLHVFSRSACQISVVIDEKKYFPKYDYLDSAPYRVITVRDALSDLPNIKSGHNFEEMYYISEPISHFQRLMRKAIRENLLLDHVCKDLGQLVEARMAHIPTTPGADWRDLPNIRYRLADGTYTNVLKYNYHDKKSGKSKTGALRGVCQCASGGSCSSWDKQENTLIPWCLPHTGNRHNHWAGLYGRVEWDGFFSTTITNPEPMGKQGRVLHPEQTRVVSVRECARSQGFSDSFRFYGNIQDKHRQVGNAVPPPLAKALGLEIRRCVSLKEQGKTTLLDSCV